MFKKLYEKIESKIVEMENSVVNRIRSDISFNPKFVQELYDRVRWVSEHNRSKDNYIDTLKSQQRTIEQLLNALSDKYEHGLFIYSEDGKIPTVIRNGKILTNDMTTSFNIDWTNGEFPNIQFEQIGGTYEEDEKKENT